MHYIINACICFLTEKKILNTTNLKYLNVIYIYIYIKDLKFVGLSI
jgi:hypothetical protein